MPVLGLRGTGSFTTDGQRPEDWREKILHLFPNGKAPLTAILSMLKSEKASDSNFHWYQKKLSGQRLCINNVAGYGVGDTSLVVDTTSASDGVTGAKSCRKGMVLLNERTDEIMWVSDDPVSDTQIQVERAMGEATLLGGTATAIDDNDWLSIIGMANAEGEDTPSSITYDPTPFENFTQIWRASLFMTRTAKKTKLRTGDQYLEAKREALEIYSIGKEKGYIFGQPKSSTGTNGQPITTTGGVLYFIKKYCSDNFKTSIGDLSETVFDGYLEQVFRYGSSEKLALCGSTALQVLSQLAKGGSITMNMEAKDSAYGMALVKYVTPFGILYLKSAPLFTEHSEWRKNILILDPAQLVEKELDTVQFLKNRQSNGTDGSMDEFLGESGLEVHHAETHMWLAGITGFAPGS